MDCLSIVGGVCNGSGTGTHSVWLLPLSERLPGIFIFNEKQIRLLKLGLTSMFRANDSGVMKIECPIFSETVHRVLGNALGWSSNVM